MSCVDTLALYREAEKEGIMVEQWDFSPPLDAVFWKGPSLPPVIGLSDRVFTSAPYHRCVLAEELGHYFTTAGSHLAYKHMNYRERLYVSKIEYKAMRWAAEFLVPVKYLKRVIVQDFCRDHYSLADCFNVTLDMIDFRLSLPDVYELFSYTRLVKHEFS